MSDALSHLIPSSFSSSSDYSDLEDADTEDSISEPKSDLTYVSVGYFPDERDFAYEDMTFQQERSPVDISGLIPAPDQETCRVKEGDPSGPEFSLRTTRCSSVKTRRVCPRTGMSISAVTLTTC